MDPYRNPELPSALVLILYLIALVIFAGVHRLSVRLRAREEEAWWVGSGRDALTLGSLILLTAAIHLLGIAGPLALLLACTLTLVAAVIGNARSFLGPSGRWAILAVVLLLGLPIALAPAPVAAGAAALVQAIVPEVNILR